MTLPGLTSLWINRGALMPPELNLKRAVFVLGKIDEILAWEKDRASRTGSAIRGFGPVSLRSSGGTVLAAREDDHRSMIFWRSVFQTHGERPITSWPFTKI